MSPSVLSVEGCGVVLQEKTVPMEKAEVHLHLTSAPHVLVWPALSASQVGAILWRNVPLVRGGRGVVPKGGDFQGPLSEQQHVLFPQLLEPYRILSLINMPPYQSNSGCGFRPFGDFSVALARGGEGVHAPKLTPKASSSGDHVRFCCMVYHSKKGFQAEYLQSC